MNNAEYIASFLSRRGIDVVFELTGGMITLLLDAVSRQGNTRIVSMHHEQGAAFAAEGWARVTNKPGVAFATSGPGATNLLTGIGSCFFDSVPAIFITGQVNSYEMKSRPGVRQQGFQETDIVAIARPLTKAAWCVTDAADLPKVLEEAFALCIEGRPGPVLIDIPMNIQRATATNLPPPPNPTASSVVGSASARRQFLDALNAALCVAQTPLVLAGGGIRSAGAVEAFRNLIETTGLPVVHSLMGVDALDSAFKQRVGLIGSYGNRWANQAVARSDLLLILGSRVDIRQTGSDTKGFQGNRQIFHVDTVPDEMNNRLSGCHVLCDDLKLFLANALPVLTTDRTRMHEWALELTRARSLHPAHKELNVGSGINPILLVEAIAARAGADTAFVTDVGQHQMWAAQAARPHKNQRFLTSGGMGAMGFGLPAAIGAAIAGRPVVLFSGDGGFQLNIQELQTVVRNHLPLKICLLNNCCHGMVRQFQESYLGSRYQSTVLGYSAPDFSAVATAYGIPAQRVAEPSALEAALDAMWSDPLAPFLLEIAIEQGTNVYPKLAFGKPFGSMEPDCAPLEMEGT